MSAATAGVPSAPTSTRVTATPHDVEQIADEVGLAAFRVERGEEEDGWTSASWRQRTRQHRQPARDGLTAEETVAIVRIGYRALRQLA